MAIDLYSKLPRNSALITCFMKLCAYLAVVLASCRRLFKIKLWTF